MQAVEDTVGNSIIVLRLRRQRGLGNYNITQGGLILNIEVRAVCQL